MSYEQAIEEARRYADEGGAVPAWRQVDATMRWRQTEAVSLGRAPSISSRVVASVGALGAAVVYAIDASIGHALGVSLLLALWLPVVATAISAVLVHRSHLGSQLLARAIWCASLVLGVLWSSGPAESIPAMGTCLALCCGFALLACGRGGLGRVAASNAFAPVAFRGTVLLGMVLALADAQLLLLLGVALHEGGAGVPAMMLAAAVSLLVGVWGLYRLRVWGVLLNLVTTSVVVASALSGALEVSAPFSIGLAVTGIIQLVLPLRMLRAFRRGATETDRAQELPVIPLTAAVIVLMLAALVLGLRPS